jgi:hypothetical protein
MARFRHLLALSILGVALATQARAGDEDMPEPKKPVEEKIPEDKPIPKEPEEPEMTTGPEPTPDFEEVKPKGKPPVDEEAGMPEVPKEPEELEPPTPRPHRPVTVYEPDKNIDYSRLLDSVETLDPGRGVLAPALGFRGYRPSMIAVGYGDRTPGYGGMVEYSWNRIGAGVAWSYHSGNVQTDPNAVNSSLLGLYGLYRWLPFDMSPYFLLGIEGGWQTDEFFGGQLGGGVEWRIYSGWTLLLGWTFHSTMHNGYMGGAIGWSF